MKLNLTTLGKDMVLQCMEGGFTMVFRSIVIGNGDDAGSENSYVSNPLLEIPISNFSRENDYVTLTGVFTNNSISDRFRVKEIGVYAEYEDSSGENVKSLFAYGYVPDDEADIIPANSDYILEMTEQVQVFVGAIENLSAMINDSMVTVSKQEFMAHVDDNSNPHKVTAEQVGLGNVPNVATDDQTPTFTRLTRLTDLAHEDTLSTIVTKIATAITHLIGHLDGETRNPHGVTPGEIGAAPSSHNHSATHITSGILSMARGGTGTNTASGLKSILETAGMPSVITGSYTGSGTYGSKNQNSLKFNSKPKMLIVMPVGTVGNPSVNGFTAIQGVKVLMPNTNNGYENRFPALNFTWGTTVSWYNETSSDYQLNGNGVSYVYLAIL